MNPYKLGEGLWKISTRKSKGRTSMYFYVKDGKLYIPTSEFHPLIWMTSGVPLTLVDGRCFMRASDLIEAVPKYKPMLEEFAKKHEVKL